jgi:hypothetical protein
MYVIHKQKNLMNINKQISFVIGGEVTKVEKWNEEIDLNFTNNKQKSEHSVIEYYNKYRDGLTWEEKKTEVNLLKMIKCYEKTYGRYFLDENKWKEIDRLKKEEKEQNREERSMKIVDPRLVNKNSLFNNNEELIE